VQTPRYGDRECSLTVALVIDWDKKCKLRGIKRLLGVKRNGQALDVYVAVTRYLAVPEILGSSVKCGCEVQRKPELEVHHSKDNIELLVGWKLFPLHGGKNDSRDHI